MGIEDLKPERRRLPVVLTLGEWRTIDAEAKRLDLTVDRLVAMLLRGLAHQLDTVEPEDRPLDRR